VEQKSTFLEKLSKNQAKTKEKIFAPLFSKKVKTK
jgi:hypothetical protein